MKKNNKIFACLSVAAMLATVTFVSCSQNKTPANKELNNNHVNENVQDAVSQKMLRIHYHRDDGAYSEWDIWLWPEGGAGDAVKFTKTDDYGVYAEVDLESGAYAGATKFGIIIRKPDWSAKDASGADRFFEIPADVGDQGYDIYLYGGKEDIYTSPDEAQSSALNNAYFQDITTVKADIFLGKTEHTLVVSDISLYDGDTKIDISNVVITSDSITFKVPEGAISYSGQYTLKVKFDAGVASCNVSLTSLYDDKEFYDAYTYYGDDLGVTFNKTRTATTFKIWAPISKSVILNIYESGTPKSQSNAFGSDAIYKRIELKKEQQGVWGATINENLHGKYYTYTVDNGYAVNEVVDPYAKSCGVNGLRGCIVDFKAIDEEINWNDVSRPNNITKPTDQIIYEMHINDMTNSETAGTKDMEFDGKSYTAKKLRGKYLAMSQTGTTYTDGTTTVTTGLDHLKELGVNTVQIQPIYDFSSVEEFGSSKGYNWGYDPLNYNCLEGSYSVNPEDGLSRIKEFKATMKAFCEAGINVNMDVVYNHTASTENTNFEKIIPGYYHRMTEAGKYSNGSGCGNEMASEKPMYRKFVVDSCKFWCETYNISGFRFDLMKLLDTVTLQQVYEECAKVYPQVTVYGEPWTGGTSTDTYVGVDQTTVIGTKGVGAFNDQIRNSIRGGNDQGATGWIHNGTTGVQKIVDGIKGTFYGGYINAEKVVNYVACHDNYCINDQIEYSSDGSNKNNKITQSDAMITLAEGIPFIYEGDEFCRTKNIYHTTIKDGKDEKGQIIHNTYNAPLYNTINWADKITNLKVNNIHKDLFKIRNDYEGFRYAKNSEIAENVTILSQGKVIAYKVKSGDKELVVVHSQAGGVYNLPGSYKLLFNNVDGLVNSSTSITDYMLPVNGTAVFVK